MVTMEIESFSLVNYFLQLIAKIYMYRFYTIQYYFIKIVIKENCEIIIEMLINYQNISSRSHY